jgi:hypothetical protein
VNGGNYAIKELGADVLLLDDGLQYLRLKHRHDVVLVDRTAPWGTGHMLPRGTLREPPENLKRANYIFLTKSEGSNEEMIAELRRYNQVADIIECRHRPVHLQNIHTGEIIPLSAVKGKYVGAVSGIAVPQSFENALKKLGMKTGTIFVNGSNLATWSVVPEVDPEGPSAGIQNDYPMLKVVNVGFKLNQWHDVLWMKKTIQLPEVPMTPLYWNYGLR